MRRLADLDELRLAAIDQAGVTMSVLSHTAPGVESARDPVAAAADARTINDHLARRIERPPKRLGGFATLPTQYRGTRRTSSTVPSANSASTAR